MLEEDLAQRIIKLVREKEDDDCLQEVIELISDYTDNIYWNMEDVRD